MEESGGMGCHPPAWGFCSANDVAVLVHDDLGAVGEGDAVKTVANAVGSNTALATRGLHNHIILIQNRTELRIDNSSCSPFLTPKWCGCCNAGCG